MGARPLALPSTRSLQPPCTDLYVLNLSPLTHTRCTHTRWRRDGPRLNELFARPDAKLIPLLRDKVLVRPAVAADTTAATTGAAATADAASATAAAAAPPPPALLQPVLLCPASAHADLVGSSPARPFLGLDAHGAPYFAVGLPGDSPAGLAEAEALAAEAGGGAEWRGARLAGPDLAPGDASLLAVASGLMVRVDRGAWAGPGLGLGGDC